MELYGSVKLFIRIQRVAEGSTCISSRVVSFLRALEWRRVSDSGVGVTVGKSSLRLYSFMASFGFPRLFRVEGWFGAFVGVLQGCRIQ